MPTQTKTDYPNSNLSYIEYRCTSCGKLFFYGWLKSAIIEIKCRNCKAIETIRE